MRQPKVDVGATARVDVRKAIYPSELRQFRKRLEEGKSIFIPEKDEDGNDCGRYATVERTYGSVVLLRFRIRQKYTGKEVILRRCYSYETLLLLTGRKCYAV